MNCEEVDGFSGWANRVKLSGRVPKVPMTGCRYTYMTGGRYTYMTTARARAASLIALLLVATSLLVAALPSAHSRAGTGSAVGAVSTALPAVVTAAAASSTVGDPAHPYSDPVWFPLRKPAKVGCVYSNCPGPYHGYWAILYAGNLDDPIYPAGAGVFHVGTINPVCPTGTTSSGAAGTWVWIDHGPAGATIYEHLNRVLAREGQLVTPATEIGTMGHSGEAAPCHTNYVHVEWRAQRLGGTRLPIPSLYACLSGGPQTFPAALGYSSWNSIPNLQVTTPALNDGCMPAAWNQTPNQPYFNVIRGPKQLTIYASARPAGTERWRVRVEMYHPSLKKYGMPTYYDHLPTTASTRLVNLSSGYNYRVPISFHNASGWSRWAYNRVVAPA
jgi:murein DD-endopeptidase MepM/ murein hydrolase activator NlpD